VPFSFLNIAFLAGIAAAAIPVLIHLFSRRRIERIPFSSLQFLEEIARRRVRRMRLTQWIILALRVLALALLALALGRPAVRGDFAFGRGQGQSAVAVVLDRSYSMRAEGETDTRWKAAVDRASEAVEALQAEDTIYLMGVDPTETAPEPYHGRAGALEGLRALDAGYGTTDLPGAVRRAGAVLAGATGLNKELFVISDFQRSGLGGEAARTAADLMSDLPPEVRVYLVPVAEKPLPNTALTDARLEGGALDRRVHVETFRFADSAADEVSVTVEAGEEILGEGVVNVLAGSGEIAAIPLARAPGEEEEVRARLSRDHLAADDVRYIPTAGASGVTTWIVQDPAKPSPYVPLALAPQENAGPFLTFRAGPTDLVAADLTPVRLLILDNVNTLPREAVERLREWRAAGGAVFISLGDRVDLRYYNEVLLPALFPGVSLGNLLGTDEATGRSWSLSPRAPGHHTFTGFEAAVAQPVTGAQFWNIVEVKTSPGMRTLAEFGPGLPALVQGEGSLLFASSLDGRWNNFPTHAAFVPLLHQALDAVLSEGSDERVLVGSPIVGVVDPAAVPSGSAPVCTGPGGLALEVTSRLSPRGLELRTPPAPVPGFYTIAAGDRAVLRRAVNVNTELESDLTPLTGEELRRLFPGDHVKLVEAGVPLGNPVREARFGREIWRELVVVVLLLMISEAWLSRRGVS
jgi:hypothetical protein